jgi:exodeoxyribonuclease VII large subunit
LNQLPTLNSQNKTITIAELARRSKQLIEGSFGLIWVEGEISNFSRASSGHCYFTLKDDRAQIRSAFFKNQSRLCELKLKDGLAVQALVRVSLYEPRGDFQLIVQRILPAGLGALQMRFEQLKKSLAAEGLFAAERKKTVIAHAKTIGIITSPQAAALQDMLQIMRRRSPTTHIILYPCLVQGERAADSICQAITQACQRQECELLVVTRGGGSLEDLWPFNEEKVARSIAACPLPIISAVGHEVDFSISDFVADLRAPTPSAAAELITTDNRQYQHQLTQLQKQLQGAIAQQFRQANHHLSHLQLKLKSPTQRLQEQAQRLDMAEQQLSHIIQLKLQRHRQQINQLQLKLKTPSERLQQKQTALQLLSHELKTTLDKKLQKQGQKLAEIAGILHTLSPLQTLERGYSILFQAEKPIVSSHTLTPGDKITARLKDGELSCTITDIHATKLSESQS